MLEPIDLFAEDVLRCVTAAGDCRSDRLRWLLLLPNTHTQG